MFDSMTSHLFKSKCIVSFVQCALTKEKKRCRVKETRVTRDKRLRPCQPINSRWPRHKWINHCGRRSNSPRHHPVTNQVATTPWWRRQTRKWACRPSTPSQWTHNLAIDYRFELIANKLLVHWFSFLFSLLSSRLLYITVFKCNSHCIN